MLLNIFLVEKIEYIYNTLIITYWEKDGMEIKEMKLIIKIIGLVGAIFALIALFTPWGIGAYLFGADLGILLGGWDFFYINTMSASATAGTWQLILYGVVMIILFILTLITMILGLLTFKKIDTRGPKAYLTPAILATVAFVLYIVGLSASTLILGYNIGFFMILIAMILFYVSFVLAKVFGITATQPMYQQPTYQQPQYGQQPQMMYSQTPQQPAQQMPPPPAPPVQQTPPPKQPPQPPQPAETPPKSQANAGKQFCQGCGAQLKPKAKFCASCGKQL